MDILLASGESLPGWAKILAAIALLGLMALFIRQDQKVDADIDADIDADNKDDSR